MRALREDERDEIESLKHFLKYINSNRNAEGWEIWKEIGDKYVLTHIVTDEELGELLDIDDMKEALTKLMFLFHKYLQENLEISEDQS